VRKAMAFIDQRHLSIDVTSLSGVLLTTILSTRRSYTTGQAEPSTTAPTRSFNAFFI
jgi:hypothetical protein